jgi:hypothetical protein
MGMRRFLIQWLAPIIVLAISASRALAQAGRFGEDGQLDHGPPAAQFAVASLTLIGVLLILCVPSRKRPAQ